MRTLVINLDYSPFDIFGWKKTMKKWLGDGNIEPLEFYEDTIRDGSGNDWPMPSVVILKEYIKTHNRSATYSKVNVIARDKSICQYCGIKHHPKELTLDHVIPRSIWKKRGYKGSCSNYENVVSSCEKCNTKKGDKTPEQAKMPLLSKPKSITRKQVFAYKLSLLTNIPESWNLYINGIVN